MTERHTRQGHHTASGPHKPRRAAGKWPDEISRDLARGLYATVLENPERYRELVPVSCWCNGEICSADPDRPGWTTWPGRDDGAPHPREPEAGGRS